MQNAHRHRNLVIGIEDHGLIARISGEDRRLVPWSDVVGIGAGRASLDTDVWILVLAIEIITDMELRALIVGEIEPPWLALTAILPSAFEGCSDFDTWAQQALAASGPITLYQRENRLFAVLTRQSGEEH